MPIVGPGGSTYTPPTARAVYRGNATPIGNGAGANVTWNTRASGSALLSLTDPLNPTIVTAGIYAVMAELAVSALTVGGSFSAALTMDAYGDNVVQDFQSPAATAADNFFYSSLTMVYYLPVGAVINYNVTNNDGAVSRNFTLTNAVLQRLT